MQVRLANRTYNSFNRYNMQIKVQKGVSLKKFCTYQTGGSAKFLAEARSPEEMIYLREFARAENIPFIIIGGGSNVLFTDEGFSGLVIINKMRTIKIHNEYILAESGALLTKVLLFAAEHNLGGISGLINVPGSVGGAIYGNAGVPDISISDTLLEVTFLPENENRPVTIKANQLEFGYRQSSFKGTQHIILSAIIKCVKEPTVKIRAEINQYAKNRALKQPIGLTCGSFFKNPMQFPSAGWLIEQAGCKGMQVGGAIVSEKHANWIMNIDKASSNDIIRLATKIQDIVEKKFKVNLEPEVQIIGKNPFKK